MTFINKSIISLFGGIVLFAVTSCQNELANINKNPNAVAHPDAAYLFTGAVKETTDIYWDVQSAHSPNPGNLFVQYWAELHYTDADRYIFSGNSFQFIWDGFYTQSIVNLDKVISLAEKQEKHNTQAAALTIRSWAFSLLTDAFGDIPYTEAIEINQHEAPKYDSQKEVYEGILADLKKADSLFDDNKEAVEGDIIYDGNVQLWEKFNNSLRLRIALRIADREPDLASNVLTQIKDSGGKYLEDNNEIAQIEYLNSPNNNPVSDQFLTRDDYRISKTIVDKLTDLNDPRLPIYAEPTKDPTPETYIGIPNGLSDGDASKLGSSVTSRPGTYFTSPHSPAVILSYAEVLFGRAEAAARNLTSENPEVLYKKAIAASLEQYDISQKDIEDYLAQSEVAYDPNNYKKSIGVQKWIALFGQGLEAYAEWRRLDYPELTPAAAGVLEGQIPLRLIYPGTEQSLNLTHYQEAVERQGEDRLTTRLWFDVN